MVKRCAASNCYNSQLTNKIAYYGFPRNEAIAHSWALASGREDLLDKKLDNLTKYHLCCDHFSKDAFMDPNVDESLLKLKKYPSIPIPTIFENNLLSTVEKVSKNPEKFVSYSKHTAYDTSNPEHREILQKRLKVREEARNTDPSEMNEEYLEEIEIERTTEVLESVDINTFCRLCGKSNTDMISIFDFNGELHPDTKCFRLMPQGMISFNDGLPQYACFECIDKLQSCLSIIDGFVANQTMFVTE